jgi:phosphohistidine swiveling domain-containing protein
VCIIEAMKLNKNNYLLAFWVQGVSVFVTDIHVDVYKDLEALFIIDNGMFKQYFTNIAYEKALDRGLKFYSSKNGFKKYQADLTKHIADFKKFYKTEIFKKLDLPINTTLKFFDFTIKLCKDYTVMNFEFTDKAFSNQSNNSIIKANLTLMSKFKDKVRAFMNIVLFEANGYSANFFTILGNQFDINPTILSELTQNEILSLYKSKKPSRDIILQRQQAFVINYDRKIIYEGQKAYDVVDAFKNNIGDKKFVYGTPASLGKTSGKVKVINVDYTNLDILNEEISKMNKGDVLVAETTAPELMLACQKASAIVTDVGGLLSHAAIVSREFGIPCIVATENATKVFKDGDIVEVDANKGIVKKID